MSAFQIIALTVLVLFTALTAASFARSRRPAVLLWILVWGAAGVAIAVPNSTTWVAHALGIERGADLVFYFAVLGGLVAFFLVFLRLRGLNREITLLTRHIATANPRPPAGPAAAKAPEPGAGEPHETTGG
jgi:hypothetical protein